MASLREFFAGHGALLRYPVLVSFPKVKPADPRAIGLLVAGAIILAVILFRWGAHLAWSAR